MTSRRMGWNGDCFLVVSDYARQLSFYRDVLGARVLHELPGTLCELRFAGSQILLSAPLGSRSDKPAMTDPPPPNHKSVIRHTPHSGS